VAWVPLSPEVKQLQALLRRLESLMEIQQQEKNRLETATDVIAQSIQGHFVRVASSQTIRHPDLKAQRDLLTTIPGIAEHSAAVLLAEIGNISAYKSARQVAAHAGLTRVAIEWFFSTWQTQDVPVVSESTHPVVSGPRTTWVGRVQEHPFVSRDTHPCRLLTLRYSLVSL